MWTKEHRMMETAFFTEEREPQDNCNNASHLLTETLVVAGLKVLAFFCRRDSGIAQPCWSRCTLAKRFGIAGLPSHIFVCLDTRSCILQGIRSRHRVAVNHAIIKQVSK